MGSRIKAMKRIWREICVCQKCDIAKYVRNRVFGDGETKSKIVLVGEAPGMDEDKSGHPFVGNAGQILRKCLLAAGIKPKDIFICNVLKCHPPKELDPPSGNRKPSKKEIENCLPFLKQQLDIIKPEVVVAMGRVAAEALLGPMVKDEKMMDLVGLTWDLTGVDYQIAVCYHPQYLGYRSYDVGLERDYIDFFKRIKDGEI